MLRQCRLRNLFSLASIGVVAMCFVTAEYYPVFCWEESIGTVVMKRENDRMGSYATWLDM